LAWRKGREIELGSATIGLGSLAKLAHLKLPASNVDLTEDQARFSAIADFRNKTAQAATCKTIAHKALLYGK
jgi:hypothetical protein